MKPVFKPGDSFSLESIGKLEAKLNVSFPLKVKDFLLKLGAGQTEDLYIHGNEHIHAFDEENGPIAGFVTFASDTMGNYYAFNPESSNKEEIYYCCHDPLGYAKIASDAYEFLRKIIENKYDNIELAANLELIEYE